MRQLERTADLIFRRILDGMRDVRIESKRTHAAGKRAYDLAVDALSNDTWFRFCIQVKSRITPQTALSIAGQFRGLSKATIPVIFAPTVTPRVAEILRQQGIGYFDQAGNCWLRSIADHLLIERQGFHTERQRTTAAANPFSSKSSRIVRLLLSEPEKGWQVRKLAQHPDVQVSPGLVVKVKRALVEEGYAVERERLLYLRDALGLLKAWSHEYSGPLEEVPFYFRGDAIAVEQIISRWCTDNAQQYALAGFSAAWRLAPEVRYTTAAVYVEDGAFHPSLLDQLANQHGGRRVDTGANLFLWRAYDPSVFAGMLRIGQTVLPVTSALQTYLDLKRLPGRGEDAAQTVLETCLKKDLASPLGVGEQP